MIASLCFFSVRQTTDSSVNAQTESETHPAVLRCHGAGRRPASPAARLSEMAPSYLDFCDKYTHLPRDRDSLSLFMRKLQEKNQPVSQQEQAALAVQLLPTRCRDQTLARLDCRGKTTDHREPVSFAIPHLPVRSRGTLRDAS